MNTKILLSTIVWISFRSIIFAADASAEAQYQRSANLQAWTYASELISEKKTLTRDDVIARMTASAFEYWYLNKYGKLDRIGGIEFKIKKAFIDDRLSKEPCYNDPLSWLDETPTKFAIVGLLSSDDVGKYKKLVSEFHEFVAKLAKDEKLKE